MAPKNSSTLPKMDDVFKSHPQPEIVRDHTATYRLRAIDLLQNHMPRKILAIQELINSEEDPSSIWWKGQVFLPEYTDIKLSQPVLADKSETVDGAHRVDGSDVNGSSADRPPIFPRDVMLAHTTDPEALDESDNEDARGVRLGLHWFEVFKLNKVQMECAAVITKEFEDLRLFAEDLRVWLELEVPLIEDGNSFGAEVQQLLIREVTEAYKKCGAMANGCRAHHGDRLKLAVDWAKYPNFADFGAAIAGSDRFDHVLLRSFLRALLGIYGGLLTKFERNWAKVINPKGSGGGSGGVY